MIVCRDIVKDFGGQRVLHGLTFSIKDGEFVSISGRSGSGKSTLLYIISTLDQPSFGQVLIDEKDVASFTSNEVHAFRNQNVGFIFQFHYLLPELTAMENILLPARNLGVMDKYKKNTQDLLAQLGISKQANRLPGEMSGGEQQRVAIARALVLRPRYIFADEPTGNLDTYNSKIVMDMLEQANKEHKTTICLVTHEPDFAARADREINLVDGRIVSSEI